MNHSEIKAYPWLLQSPVKGTQTRCQRVLSGAFPWSGEVNFKAFGFRIQSLGLRVEPNSAQPTRKVSRCLIFGLQDLGLRGSGLKASIGNLGKPLAHFCIFPYGLPRANLV